MKNKKISSIVGILLVVFASIISQISNDEVKRNEQTEKIQITQKTEDSVSLAFDAYQSNINKINTNNILFSTSHFTSIINSKNFNDTEEIIDKIYYLLYRSQDNYVSSNYPVLLNKEELEIISIFFLNYSEENKQLEVRDFKFYLTQFSKEIIMKIQYHDFTNPNN